MRSPFTIVAYGAWLAIGLVWLRGYFSTKKNPGLPQLALQIPASVLLITGIALLFIPPTGALSSQITPSVASVGIIGLALDLIGVGVAIWARLTLGTNWAGMVMTIKQDHELVQSG